MPRIVDMKERFEEKYFPEPNSGCWIWTAGVDKDGYGKFWLDGKTDRAHAVAKYIYDDMPMDSNSNGMRWDHLCKTPGCVNPAHLELVTHKENTRRSDNFIALNMRKTHCPQGHPYYGYNLIINTNNQRVCRECNRVRCLEYSRRQRNV